MSVAIHRGPAAVLPGAEGPVRVSRLLTTPVKGLRIGEREAIELTPVGARDDRAFVLADPSGGMVAVTRHGALLRCSAELDADTGRLTVRDAAGAVAAQGPTDVEGPELQVRSTTRAYAGRRVPGPWDAVLTALVGRETLLVRTPAWTSGYDVRPVTLLGGASVRDLEARSGEGPIDARRFRMLVELEGTAPYAEDAWDGRHVRIGGAELRVRGPVPRCAATTRAPEGGERDLPTVRMIREHRGIVPTEAGRGVPFGVYADVVVPGEVRLGDAVEPVS